MRRESLKRFLLPAFWVSMAFLFCVPGEGANLDQHLYSQIHDRWHSESLDPVMEAATDLGGVQFGLGLNALLATFGEKKEQETAKLALTAMVSSGACVSVIKFAVDRPRPGEHGPDNRWDSSFPSGHATGAFALASVFGSRYPRLRIPVYLGATLIGLSRIYLGRHYPSDVLAGAALGVTFGQIVLRKDDFILGVHF